MEIYRKKILQKNSYWFDSGKLTLFGVVQEVRLLQSQLSVHYFKHMRVDNFYNIGIKGLTHELIMI